MENGTKEGIYCCQSCGEFFKSEITLNPQCPSCSSYQLTDTIWDKVVQRRDKQLMFNSLGSESQTGHSRDRAAEEDGVNSKLDIVGRQRAKQRGVSLFIVCLWIAGIAIISYTVAQRTRPENAKTTLDGSVTLDDLEQSRQIANQCLTTLNSFLRTKDILSKSSFVYQPNIDLIDLYYQSGKNLHPPEVSSIQSVHRLNPTTFVIHGSTADKASVEAVFVLQQGKWLLDWEAFTNYSPLSFSEFIAQQPTGKHTFRLQVQSKLYGNERSLTLIESKPNHLFYNFHSATREHLSIPADSPLRSSLDDYIRKAEAYRQFNPTLNDNAKGLLGTKDPEQTYRATVTLEFTRSNGNTKLQLLAIERSHWLGKHYSDPLTPAQQLCSAKD